MRLEDVIRRPIISEKPSTLKETANQYVFEIDMKANKFEVKEAVKAFFGVEAQAVNTMVMPGRNKRFGRYMGRRNKWKKAVVTLAEGQSIDYFGTEADGIEGQEV